MKKLRKHWLAATSKVLSALIALLGLTGCGTSKRAVSPTMKSDAPNNGVVLPDTIIQRVSKDWQNIRVMYGPPPARLEKVEKKSVEGTKK
ncbi:MAG: hypothetical protein K2J84_04915 [Bacteroidaceae bacterium]|nr:hypothetical protein [Bacteroidaceae bacterium]